MTEPAAREQSTEELLPQLGPSKDLSLIVHDDSEYAHLLDTAKFQHLCKVAGAFSRSTLVPEHFQGAIPAAS